LPIVFEHRTIAQQKEIGMFGITKLVSAVNTLAAHINGLATTVQQIDGELRHRTNLAINVDAHASALPGPDGNGNNQPTPAGRRKAR
jgi:hypothetical protein